MAHVEQKEWSVSCGESLSGLTGSSFSDKSRHEHHDCIRLEAIVSDRRTQQKEAPHARVIAPSADGRGTTEIMCRSGRSKPVVWQSQERFMQKGVGGFSRDKTRNEVDPFQWTVFGLAGYVAARTTFRSASYAMGDR